MQMVARLCWRHAGLNFFKTWMIVPPWIFLALIVFDEQIAQLATGTRPDPRLRITMVEFSDGMFHQIVQPDRGDGVQAEWSASIFSGQEFICGGGGNGTYVPRTTPAEYTPDDWAGDDCSGLVVGQEYTAVVSWSHDVEDGRNLLKASFDFIYTEANE